MRILLTIVSIGLAASPCWSQFYVPAQSNRDQFEANDRTNYPLMRAESRSQFILSPAEVGPPTTLTQLQLRYNGPSLSTGGGTIANLDIYLSNNGVSPGQSTGVFDSNYTGTLTRVFSAQNHTFGVDSSSNPGTWGGATGEFRFVFSSPFNYTGGNLVVEIRVDGNTNSGATPANCLLDAEIDGRAGTAGGSAVSNGVGCFGTEMGATGQLAPGGQIALMGSNLGVGSPVFANLGTSRAAWGVIPLPFSLAILGAPGCSIYNDWSVSIPMVPGPSGNIAPYSAGSVLSLPNLSSVAGAVLQMQYFAIQPGINPFSATTSNNVEVTLGTRSASVRGYFGHFHHNDRDAVNASYSAPATLAMRFN